MKMRILNILCCFLVAVFTLRCQADPFGCVLDDTLLNVDGLVGNVYYYPSTEISDGDAGFNNTAYNEVYFTSYASNATIVTQDDGHSQSEAATVALGVRMFDFLFTPPLLSSETWDYATYLSFENGSHPMIPISNYAISLNGYLVPNITGEYTFFFAAANNEMLISIGNGFAPFDCCEVPDQTKGISTAKAVINNRTDTNEQIFQLTLVAGFAYPINVFYIVDFHYPAATPNTGFVYVDPTGSTAVDFTGFAFSSFDIEKEELCGAEEETVFWTEDITGVTSYSISSTFTTTYTTTSGSQVTDYALEVSAFVINYVPYPYETFTSYIPYDGTEATTTSTQIIIDETETKKIFDVNVPYSTSLSVSTSYYNGSIAANASTVLLTVTPASGIPYVSAVVIENIPEGHTSSTLYISGANNVETTYSIDYLTFNGTDGTPTVETVYYVQTPYSVLSTTSTSFYEGALETTQTTIVTTVTPVNGSIYVNDIVVIDKPEVVVKATALKLGTYTQSTTLSTGLVTVYGFDGMPTVYKTYYVGIPTSSSTSTASSSSSTVANGTSTASSSSSTVVNGTSTTSSSSSTVANGRSTTSSITSTTSSTRSTASSSSSTVANGTLTASSSSSSASSTTSAFVTTTSAASSTSTASSSTSLFGNGTYTTKGPAYSNSTSNTYGSSFTEDSVAASSLFTSSSTSSTFSSISTPEVSSASTLVESQTFTSTLVTFAENDATSTSASETQTEFNSESDKLTESATSTATESDESMNATSLSTLTAGDYTTTVITITSCGSKSCYPKTLTTAVPGSSSIMEPSSISSPSAATLSAVSGVESNAGVANRNVGFLNKFAFLLAANIIFI